MIRALLCAVAVGAACVACGSDDDDAATPATSSSTTSTTDSIATCSARALATPSDASGLPEAVETTRERIIAAARACDYDELDQLAMGGSSGFTFSYGGGTSAATFWRNQEANGEEPLAILVKILGLASATRSTEGETHYLWPAAHAYDSWAEVPERHRTALNAIYTEDEVEQFRRANAYLGHRVGISGSGEWLFFVAGD